MLILLLLLLLLLLNPKPARLPRHHFLARSLRPLCIPMQLLKLLPSSCAVTASRSGTRSTNSAVGLTLPSLKLGRRKLQPAVPRLRCACEHWLPVSSSAFLGFGPSISWQRILRPLAPPPPSISSIAFANMKCCVRSVHPVCVSDDA